MKMLIVILPFLTFLFILTGTIAAAELLDTRLLELQAIRETADSDSIEELREEVISGDSLTREPVITKSPSLALLRSAVLPGWGQFYTGHPYKGSVIFVAEGMLVAFAWSENRKANRNLEIFDRTGESVYFDKYKKHFDRGQNLLSWAIVTFLYNMADAYVSAHLYDFDSKVSFDDEEGRLDVSMIWRFQ
jgi:hypothetical protein